MTETGIQKTGTPTTLLLHPKNSRADNTLPAAQSMHEHAPIRYFEVIFLKNLQTLVSLPMPTLLHVVSNVLPDLILE